MKINTLNNETDLFETLLYIDSLNFSGEDIHNISYDMLSDAPKFIQILPDLIYFFHNSILVAHNADFDKKFLLNEFSLANFPFRDLFVADTLRASRRKYKNFKNHKLVTLQRELEIPYQGVAHSALSDALTTKELFLKLNDGLDKKIWREEHIFKVENIINNEALDTINVDVKFKKREQK